MATVSSLGSGSGLQLESLLTQLMIAEQAPLLNLQKKEASYNARISALGSLKGAISSLQSAAAALKPSIGQTAADKYASYTASVADTTIASASAGKGAVEGTYSLEVSTLAKAQKLVSPASAFSSASQTLDVSGTLTIKFGKVVDNADPTPDTFDPDSTRELNIDIASGSSLNSIRDAINAKNGDVSATIVTGNNGPQLILTSKKTGTDSVMQLSGLTGADALNFSFDPLNPGSGSLSESATGGQSASDATFSINGISATSSSNTVTGVLDGVTLTLTKATAIGTTTTVTVGKNTTTALSSALTAFVKAYNDANTTMSGLGTYNSTTKVAGTLQGDAVLRTSQNQVRSLLFSTVAGGSSAYQRLSDIGVSVAKDGSLSLDSTKLNKAIAADYNGVVDLVAKVGDTYNKSLEAIVGTSGSLVAVTNSTNSMIKSLSKRETQLTNRLAQVEANYRRQFTALDNLVASMNSTSTYLTQQLKSLENSSSSS